MKIALVAAAAASLAGPSLASAAAVSPSPPCTQSSRTCLERIGRLYIDALLAHDGSKLPLAPGVRRTENALTNAKGAAEVRESFARTNMVKGAREVRSYVDTEQGEVIFYFVIDVDLGNADVNAAGSTRAGDTEYKTAVSVPPGSYTVHEAERFKVVRGMISEIEIIAHVENDRGQGSGWPISRDPVVGKK